MTESVWRQAIVDAHPELFLIEFGGSHHSPGYPAVGDGWRGIVETAVKRIVAVDVHCRVKIDQIKEKFGYIRIYWSSIGKIDEATNDAIEEAIALAESRSECTCESCGREGRLYSAGSWLITACTDHARGEEVPVRPGHENLRVVTTIKADREETVSCRRYIRATDSFIDVDPSTLDLED